ncbi:MAG: 3-deoxy-D-manno-octulosonic acid transferase, partial [Thiogranum sp.]
AGSTHTGEEAQLLVAHRRVLASCAGALLVIAPRHPERAADVSTLCRKSGIGFRFASDTAPPGDDVQVLIVDTLGELVYFYAVALAVFVGGSLVPAGGHNPVEAILAGAPVISGPYTDNFRSIYHDLIQGNAAQEIDTERELAERVCAYISDAAQRKAAVAAGLMLVDNNRGALQHCLQLLEKKLQSE